jgi:hypothetical protein
MQTVGLGVHSDDGLYKQFSQHTIELLGGIHPNRMRASAIGHTSDYKRCISKYHYKLG